MDTEVSLAKVKERCYSIQLSSQVELYSCEYDHSISNIIHTGKQSF